MGKVILLIERAVKARGLNKNALPDESKVEENFFDDDFNNINSLQKLTATKLDLPEKPTLFYPGSGSDVLTPLLYVTKFFPGLREIKFIFNDTENYLGLIRTILDDVGVQFSEKKNQLLFYWNGLLVQLLFLQKDVFSLRLPSFDIYFERAFRIMKDKDPDFESRMFSKLKSGGILISDSGFRQFPLHRINVAQQLSSYGKMIVGIKK